MRSRYTVFRTCFHSSEHSTSVRIKRMSDLVVVTQHDQWAVIRLARAAKRNALNREMRIALRSHLEALKPHARVIVLTGSDAVFCAGLDLKEREAEKAAGQA